MVNLEKLDPIIFGDKVHKANNAADAISKQVLLLLSEFPRHAAHRAGDEDLGKTSILRSQLFVLQVLKELSLQDAFKGGRDFRATAVSGDLYQPEIRKIVGELLTTD